jgi:hypothetical protein
MSRYFSILSLYDQWEGEKVLIYYEDLLSNPTEELRKTQKVLGSYFTKDIDSVVKKCRDLSEQIFSVYPGTPLSKGRSTTYHSDKQEGSIMRYMDESVRALEPHLYDRYLLRYDSSLPEDLD